MKALLVGAAALAVLGACTYAPDGSGPPLPPAITPETLIATNPSKLTDSKVCEYIVAGEAWVVWLEDWSQFAETTLGRELNVQETIDKLIASNETLTKVAELRDICGE